MLRQGCTWNIKNGKKTKFWLDSLVLQVPLKEKVGGVIPEALEEAVVADLVHEDGNWRTELFSDLLPPEINNKILSTAVDKLSREDDTIFWSASTDGCFSCKSAYGLLMG
ncbi:unnamed protein product [Linum trigynum]|uniref:Reverse transcriptase zinc-binding domain-containing protein n=1 Tax=Linum trigynum TaxID=586398 RepID=A0AAV2G8P8_9ROSI